LLSAIDAINGRKTRAWRTRERTCFAVAKEILADKGLNDESCATAEKTMGLESLSGQLFDDLPDRRHVFKSIRQRMIRFCWPDSGPPISDGAQDKHRILTPLI
jgi:hypothetical protein